MKEREIVASDLQSSESLQSYDWYVALWRQGVVPWADLPSSEKTLITKAKEEKMGQIKTMKTNSKRRKHLRLATWNERSL
jgi:hypothetical protein